MKWIIRIGGVLLGLIVLGVLALAGIPWLSAGAERIGSTPFRAHLAANETVLDLDRPDAGFALAAEDHDARYVLLGEMHGFAVPQKIDLALVTHLTRNGPPRWYLAELTPCEAIAVNAYIAGGAQEGMEAVFDRFADMGLQWNSQEFFGKVEAFRALDATLPEERRVRMIGVDQTRGTGLALDLPETDARPDLGTYTDASALAINLALASVQTEGEGRYTAIFDRMRALSGLPGWDEARFYGFWGNFHTSGVNINDARTLSSYLEDDSQPWAGDVVRINTLCIGAECYNMMVAAGLPAPMQGPNGETYIAMPMGQHNPYFMRVEGAGDLLKAMGSEEIALYRIDTPASPYHKGTRLTGVSGYLSMVNRWDIQGTAADWTDYVVAFKSSPPLSPRRGEVHDLTGKALTE